MEDAHITCPDLGGFCEGTGLFAVFDGHGGREVAHFCEAYLPDELRRLVEKKGVKLRTDRRANTSMITSLLREAFHNMDDMLRQEKYFEELLSFRRATGPKTVSRVHDASDDVDDEIPSETGLHAASPANTSLRESFDMALQKRTQQGSLTKHEAKQIMMKMVLMKKAEAAAAARSQDSSSSNHDYSDAPARNVGCTAVCILLSDKEITCANAGDSRAVLCRRGRAVALSHDHKPNMPGERRRIESAGGSVEKTQTGRVGNTMFRVNGKLNLSRSIGDLEFKQRRDLPPEKQIISATPDVIREKLADDDEFLVLACDGIWDVKSNQEVCTFIRSRIQRGQALDRTIEQLLDSCITPDPKKTQGLGADNMTCVVVQLDQWNPTADTPAPSCGCSVS
eukprot:TRINITY_DN77282_c0_g1_i1.p1 TRINITY_DN77282_c0_g1~~TRINITY_DN77282_c0_g1_i1.p1  ORF type:complete len:462 (+),score=65.02 TRINITY_DN77282_c0_g1_i1:202-1386(+)